MEIHIVSRSKGIAPSYTMYLLCHIQCYLNCFSSDKQCLHTPLVEGEKAVVNGEQAAPKSKTFTPNGRDLVKDLKPTSSDTFYIKLRLTVSTFLKLRKFV